MAGPRKLELGGIVEGMLENILAKEYLDPSAYTRIKSVDHRCLLLAMGMR